MSCMSRSISIIVAIYSTCAGTHRPESVTQPTVLAVHGQFFERLKTSGAQSAPNVAPSNAVSSDVQDADLPVSVERGGVLHYQDLTVDGIVVNHIKAKAYSNPKEVLMGQTASFMMLGFSIFAALVLYTVNFPDPQVENYANKLVSTSISIYAAVLVEKIFHAFLTPCIVGPLAKGFGYENTDLGYDVLQLVFSGFAFIGWFCALSILCYRYRESKQSLYAVQSFVSHIVAFMAIFSFGYFQKRTCSRCSSYDNGVMCYLWFPFITFLFVWLLGFIGKFIRTKVDPSIANANSADQHVGAGHSWSSVAKDAEGDGRAIAVSFLCRQCALFMITGRIPGIRGDTEPHSEGEWHALWVFLTLISLALLFATYVKEKHSWEGEQGALGEGMHFSQTLLAMVFGWIVLTVVHWIAQLYMKYAACWNLMTAFAVSPIVFAAIVLVDRLSDHGLVGRATELVMLNSLGIVLGFAWEQAFGSGIDTVTVTFKMGFAFECAICVVMIVFVLPAWRLYIVPKASLPIPSRVGDPGSRLEKASAPSDSASGGKLAGASDLASLAQAMPDTD